MTMTMTQTGELHIGEGPISFRVTYQDLLADQGVTIEVQGEVEGNTVPILRFDCFDHEPHYHYMRQDKEERLKVDRTTEGDPLEWALHKIRSALRDMVTRAGYGELAGEIDGDKLEPALAELEDAARSLARENRSTVVHNRGDVIIEAGPVRFGLEFRELAGEERGVAIHVMGDVGDQELELLTFDCFEMEPHYHYGPRAKNQRLYLDKTVAPDPLRWALDLFKGGKLAPMLERAGYPDHAARLNPAVVADRVAEVESVALRMREDHQR